LDVHSTLEEAMPSEPKLDAELPSIKKLRALTSPPGARAFKVAILIGPGFIPMDIVGVQAVLGLMPGAEIHLAWRTRELVEGFPGWWTKPTTTFADCPHDLDVIAAPMLPPEIQADPEVIAFVADRAQTARYVIGVCNGVALLGAAGLLHGKRVTASHNALAILPELGAAEVMPSGSGVVVDGNLYTAGPGIGSFEAALLVAADAFGRSTAELAELIIEYDPHPPFGVGAPAKAGQTNVATFEAMMADFAAAYRDGARRAYEARRADAEPNRFFEQ
jgi:putative intracellular protease/amidase